MAWGLVCLALAGAFGEPWPLARGALETWAASARQRGLDEPSVQRFLREKAGTPSHTDTAISVLLNFMGIIDAFHVNFSAMLVYGVLRKRSKLVNVWVRYSMVAFLLRVLLLFVIAILVMCNGHIKIGLVLLFANFAMAPLSGYFIIVVNSYHSQLQRQEALKNYANDWQG